MRTLLFILLLWAAPVRAEWSDWSTDTQALFVASTVAIGADWATTRNMTRRYDEGYYELNPILGRHPSTAQVDAYMIGMLVSNYFITDWLPQQYRIFYLGWRTITHGSAAHNNMSIGLRLQF